MTGRPLSTLPSLAAPSQAGAGRLPESPRFRFTSYIGMLLGLAQFYSIGWWLTVRQAWQKNPRAHQQACEELSSLFAGNLRHYQKWGCLRVEDTGLARLREENGLILVANHPSLLDAVVVLAVLPQTTCVMRASLLRQFALRGGAQACGFIPNDTGAEFVRLALTRLAQGMHLLIFPEGTRTGPGEVLGPFKGGFALVAVKSRRPVQTLLIEHHGTNLGKGNALWAPGRYPALLRLRLGERFTPEPGERPRAFQERVRAYFCRSLQAVREG